MLQSGGSVTVDWNDSNVGSGPAAGSWYDQVSVVNTTTGQTLANANVTRSTGGGTLAAGQAEAHQFTFTLPNGAPGVGQLNITVTADPGMSLLEYNSSGVLDTKPLGSHDGPIDAGVVSGPHGAGCCHDGRQSVARQPDQVTWTDFNQGNAAASGSWTDFVYLADNSAGTDPQFLQAFSFSGTVPQNAGMPQSATVTLPQSATGSEWLVVQTGISASFYDTNSQGTAVAADSFTVPPTLLVSLSSHSTMDNGSPISGTVTRNGATTGPLSVALSSSDLSSAVVDPSDLPSVTIPAGQASAAFTIDPVNDGLYQPPQAVTITAAASGYASGSDQLTITDVETPALGLTIATDPATSPVEFNESAGSDAATGTITRNTLETLPALSVSIGSSNPSLASAGNVTIPVGQMSATFPIAAYDNGQITGPRSVVFSAAAAGFNGATANVLVIDDELPTLRLSIPLAEVADNAANPVQAMVSIGQPANTDLRVALATSNADALTVPQYVDIPQGQTSAVVLLSPVDQGLVVGPQAVTVTARLVNTLNGQPLDTDQTPGQITVTDTNSPLLSVTLANETFLKGQGTTGTVTINQVVSQNLTVQLATTNPEVAVPSTVIIAAGTLSQTFPVTTVNTGVYTGNQTGQITASVAGNSFQPGSQLINVTDIDLPNLAVTGIAFPGGAAGVTNQKNFQVSYTVANEGLVDATGTWTEQRLPAGRREPRLLASFSQTGLAQGTSYTNTAAFTLPGQVGSCQVQVQCDATASAVPPDSNRAAGVLNSAPITVSAAYCGTVTAVPSQAGPGATIALSGQAISNTTGLPVPYAPLSVEVVPGGTPQVLDEITNANGNWSGTFVAAEPGHYSINAAYPGAAFPAPQAGVNILGMSFNASPSYDLTPNVPITDKVTLSNLSDVALTDLQCTPNLGNPAVPIDVSVTYLNAQGNLLSAGDPAGRGNRAGPVHVDRHPAGAADWADRADDRQRQGRDRVVANRVPHRPGVGQPGRHARVAAGRHPPGHAAARFLHRDQQRQRAERPCHGQPPRECPVMAGPGVEPDDPLARARRYGDGDPAVDARRLGDAHPALRDDRPERRRRRQHVGALHDPGDVRADGQPGQHGGRRVGHQRKRRKRAGGATISLTNPDTGQVVATATSDANGAFNFTDITEGTYQLNASASGHLPVQQPVVIMPGITNQITDAQGNVQPIFLPLSLVTYNWTIVPTQIPDNYQITLQANFLTNVPVPNVVVDKPLVCPLVPAGGSTQFDLTLTNEGLVQTNDLQWVIPSNSYYTITPQVTVLPVLPAQSEQVAQLTITPKPGDTPGDPAVTCPIIISLEYSYDAGGPRWRTVNVTVYPFLVSAASYQHIANDWAGGTPALSVEQQDLYQRHAGLPKHGADRRGRRPGQQPELVPGGLRQRHHGQLERHRGHGFQMLTNFCDLSTPPTVGTPISGSGEEERQRRLRQRRRGGYGGGGGGGGYGGGTYGTSPSTPYLPPVAEPVIPSVPGVPAEVTIETDQEATMTRDAFTGTLEIDNSNSNPLTGVQVTLDIRQHVPPNGGSSRRAVISTSASRR